MSIRFVWAAADADRGHGTTQRPSGYFGVNGVATTCVPSSTPCRRSVQAPCVQAAARWKTSTEQLERWKEGNQHNRPDGHGTHQRSGWRCLLKVERMATRQATEQEPHPPAPGRGRDGWLDGWMGG